MVRTESSDTGWKIKSTEKLIHRRYKNDDIWKTAANVSFNRDKKTL